MAVDNAPLAVLASRSPLLGADEVETARRRDQSVSLGRRRKIAPPRPDALTPRVLVQRLFDTLGGRNLGLGIVDRRFGQLGGPVSGCDCV